eukprot:TRINITY_DN50129_c0_g1_i1.p1 TRINITY_DN50129_c0_g1~~TRINITY_DN50129_c0_g1_i1.p1  ORF type:complete len:546 (+),score=89.96 TRINITY_DN50129_c0_g1_i1:108-1745(+)
MSDDLAQLVEKALSTHGIGQSVPPAKPELWQQFQHFPHIQKTSLRVENRFYTGYSHEDIDWARPVHAVFVDFKGDGMQLGMLLRRFCDRGEQFVFVGNPLPFNGGWHFSAVNDFEHPCEQSRLDPSWQNIRIWHRINYVPTLTEDGAPALTPRESYSAEKKCQGAIALHEGFNFAVLHFIGGLMPHTLNATLMADGSPGSQVVAKHLELGAKFATIGHGLDVLIACGTQERSLVAGFTAAAFPKQTHLLRISDMREADGEVCKHDHVATCASLISTGYWGVTTSEGWFELVGLPPASEPVEARTEMLRVVATTESVAVLDLAQLPGMAGARFDGSQGVVGTAAAAPRVAVLVDEVADPVEVYTIVSHLIDEDISFMLVSHSTDEGCSEMGRRVTTETVFGNAMYPLRDCACVMTTTPADQIPDGHCFDAFFVAGGQCPYHMLEDVGVRGIVNGARVAAAVCHGPEVLIGSKWLAPEVAHEFTAYYGAWMSFRHVLGRFQRRKPGEAVQDTVGCLFSGNAPNSTKEMVVQACAALRALTRQGDSAA